MNQSCHHLPYVPRRDILGGGDILGASCYFRSSGLSSIVRSITGNVLVNEANAKEAKEIAQKDGPSNEKPEQHAMAFHVGGRVPDKGGN